MGPKTRDELPRYCSRSVLSSLRVCFKLSWNFCMAVTIPSLPKLLWQLKTNLDDIEILKISRHNISCEHRPSNPPVSQQRFASSFNSYESAHPPLRKPRPRHHSQLLLESSKVNRTICNNHNCFLDRAPCNFRRSINQCTCIQLPGTRYAK